MPNFFQFFSQFFILSNNEKRFLTYISIFVGLYILPIILADFYYLDDWGRTLAGESFDGAGRWVQTAFYRFLVPLKMVDVAPLTQILSGVFFIIAGLAIYRKLLADSSPFFASILAFIFIANPYFLENLSYRFDSMGMTLATLFAVFAWYLITDKPTMTRYIAAGVSLALALCTYQIAFVIYAGLVALSFYQQIFKSDPDTKKLFIWLAKAILTLAIPLGIYQTIISVIGIHSFDTYKFSAFALSDNIEILLPFVQNKILIIFFTIPFVFATIYSTYRAFTLKNKLLLVFAFLFPIIIFSVASLNLIFLTRQIEFRIYYGFAIILLFTFSQIYTLLKVKIDLRNLILIPAIYLFVNSYIYSNYQKISNRDIRVVSGYIIDDLKDLGLTNKNISIAVDGLLPESQEIHQLKQGLLLPYTRIDGYEGFLIPETLSNGSAGMMKKNMPITFTTPAIRELFATRPFVKDNTLYSLQINDNIVYIKFKPQIFIRLSQGIWSYEDINGKALPGKPL